MFKSTCREPLLVEMARQESSWNLCPHARHQHAENPSWSRWQDKRIPGTSAHIHAKHEVSHQHDISIHENRGHSCIDAVRWRWWAHGTLFWLPRDNKVLFTGWGGIQTWPNSLWRCRVPQKDSDRYFVTAPPSRRSDYTLCDLGRRCTVKIETVITTLPVQSSRSSRGDVSWGVLYLHSPFRYL